MHPDHRNQQNSATMQDIARTKQAPSFTSLKLVNTVIVIDDVAIV